MRLEGMALWRPPPLGTLIDYGSLKLVEVVRAGHYEVVYRAVDVLSHPNKSYSVKCRAKAIHQTASQRLFHTREITLHRLASGHPSIATLYRVIEDTECDFMVLDYSSDRDLLFQITAMRRYVGNDALIKQVFLQILDAVAHCHAIGIYHRTLHPGNISCFDQGRRVAINNFRGATINAASTGFRQGVAYSAPECRPGHDLQPYSPMHSDIWSLGILLLNLVAGRTPWRSADVQNDKEFATYVRHPSHFFSTRFPISQELQHLLLETLTFSSRKRVSLPRLKLAVENMQTFYSRGTEFLDGVGLCIRQIDHVDGTFSPNEDPRRALRSHQSWDDWPNRRYGGFWELPQN